MKAEYFVMLNDEGKKALNAKAFINLRKNKDYFSCTAINPNKNYFYMEIPFPDAPQKILEFSIPHHYVSYFLSGHKAQEFLGFASAKK